MSTESSRHIQSLKKKLTALEEAWLLEPVWTGAEARRVAASGARRRRPPAEGSGPVCTGGWREARQQAQGVEAAGEGPARAGGWREEGCRAQSNGRQACHCVPRQGAIWKYN
jgi:hypothetical protein